MTDHKPITDAEAKEWKEEYKRICDRYGRLDSDGNAPYKAPIMAGTDPPDWDTVNRLLADRKVAMEIIEELWQGCMDAEPELDTQLDGSVDVREKPCGKCFGCKARVLLAAVKGGE